MLKLMFVFSSLLFVIPCQAKTIYVDAYGLVWQGAVWSLGIQSDKAWNPEPPDGQEFVSITPTLSWKAGIDAQWHVIYFGTSFDDVNDSIVQPLVPPPLSYKGYQPVGDEDWDPTTDGGLTFDFTTTYYWRIDEGHEEFPPPIVGGMVIKGDVWSFTTEAQPIFVDIDAAGANDGTSWEDAYKYLQDALTDAGSAAKPVEICVAQGIYKPDQSPADPNGSGDRYATFQLISGVTLKGGYAGFGEPDPNARDIALYETILNGDLNGDDLPTYPHNVDDNSYRVVTGSSTEPNAVLDGLTISDGILTGMYNYGGSPAVVNCTFSDNRGSGMYNTHFSDPVVTNCNFSSNLTGENGGAMYNQNSNPVVTGCTFVANSAMRFGGAVYNDGCSPTFECCTFSDNSAETGGGGMYNHKSSPRLTNCTFKRNWSGLYGGGLDTVSKSSNPIVIGCTFIGNTADFRGGGTSNGSSSLTLINCIFINNSAMDKAGAMYISSLWKIDVSNCTFYGNEAPEGNMLACYSYNVQFTNCIMWDGGNEIWNPPGSVFTITYSNVYGGRMSAYDPCESIIWGEGNIDADPCFADPGYWDTNGTPGDANDDLWVNGDYHLKSQAGRWDPNSESWVMDDLTSPCIDAGNPGCPLGDEPSPNGNRRNMGAYGGTDQASKSPANWRNIADMTNDWTVDSNDLEVFVDYWLQTGECIPSDLNRSQFVDFNDFAILGLHWSYPSALNPGIVYQIEDCNMEAGLNQPSAEDSNDTRFSVRVEGNYIHFKDLITANCCLDEIELQMTVEDGLITIHEIEHLSTPCFCICDYPTTATLGPFEPGIYLLEVIDIDGKSLGIVEVTIGGAPEPGITYQIEDCNLDAADVFAAEPPDLTRFTATVEGPYIHFKDMMTANCCPDKLELEMTVEDNLIIIQEIEYTSEGCRCICSFPVTAILGPFEPGIYALEVYETTGGFIGATTVTIGPDG